MRGVMSEVRRSGMWATPNSSKDRCGNSDKPKERAHHCADRRDIRIPATSSTAALTSSFTTTASNWSACASSASAAARRRSISAASSSPRSTRRRRCSSRDGGRTNTSKRSVGKRLPGRQRALDVDLQQHVLPGGQVLLDGRTGGAVRVAEDLERLEEAAAARASASNSSGRTKRYSTPSTSPGRGARVVAETESQIDGSRSQKLAHDGALADPRRADDHEENCQVRPRARSSGGRADPPAGCDRDRGSDDSR